MIKKIVKNHGFTSLRLAVILVLSGGLLWTVYYNWLLYGQDRNSVAVPDSALPFAVVGGNGDNLALYHPGDVVGLRIAEFCKNTDADLATAVFFNNLTNNRVYTLKQTEPQAGFDRGCYYDIEIFNPIFLLPEDALCGEYEMIMVVSYDVNWARQDEYRYRTKPFRVQNGECPEPQSQRPLGGWVVSLP